MVRVLLHAGTGKTGTSSIQQSLTIAQRAGRLGTRAYYPIASAIETRFGLTNPKFSEHNNIIVGLASFEELPFGLRQHFGDNERAVASQHALLVECENAISSLDPDGTIVLSAEYVSELDEAPLQRLRDQITSALSPQIEVALYLRPPAELYLAQLVQSGRHSTAFVPPAEFRYDYQLTVERFELIFGKGNVHFRPFVRSSLVEHDVVQDFSAQFLRMPIESHSTNAGLSIHSLAFLRRYRQFMNIPDWETTRRLQLLVPLLEQENDRWSLNQRPALRAQIRTTIEHNHIPATEFLEGRFPAFKSFAKKPRRPLAPRTSDQTFEAMFTNYPNRLQLERFSLALCDSLLLACVVMNEQLNS